MRLRQQKGNDIGPKPRKDWEIRDAKKIEVVRELDQDQEVQRRKELLVVKRRMAKEIKVHLLLHPHLQEDIQCPVILPEEAPVQVEKEAQVEGQGVQAHPADEVDEEVEV